MNVFMKRSLCFGSRGFSSLPIPNVETLGIGKRAGQRLQKLPFIHKTMKGGKRYEKPDSLGSIPYDEEMGSI